MGITTWPVVHMMAGIVVILTQHVVVLMMLAFVMKLNPSIVKV